MLLRHYHAKKFFDNLRYFSKLGNLALEILSLYPLFVRQGNSARSQASVGH